MATLARELRVPALLGTGTATRDIPVGALVTVDAGAGFVYLGKVPGLTAAATVPDGEAAADQPLRPTAASVLLTQVAERIVPLNLIDARSREFTPEGCRTLHDLTRFVHEKSYAEMFRMGERLGDARAGSFLLDVFLPIDLYIIDLGGGVSAPATGLKVKPAQITSRPLAALLTGMLDKRLPRFGPRPIDVGGLFSVIVRHAMSNPEADQTFRDPCYAIVSDAYLNYTARVGYHFGAVDSYCSPSPNRNYVSFRFKGGAADWTRRGRRARSIAGVLREHGFSVEVKGDQVAARLGKASGEEIALKLEMLGRLLQFFRQMDASMATDEAVQQFQDAFLADDFRLEGGDRNPG
jgi:pyruvate,water dikinase